MKETPDTNNVELMLHMAVVDMLSDICPPEDKPIWEIPKLTIKITNGNHNVMELINAKEDMEGRRKIANKAVPMLNQICKLYEQFFEEIKESESHA